MRATDGRLVTVNATGCLEVFSTPFPESAWQVPWLHSLFGNAAAVASGVAAAMRATGRDDIRVLAQAGDGGTVDIGLGCLSGMFERNDDVLFVCYDNQGYMNTGVQRSGATPAGASTANTRPVASGIGNAFGTGKNLPRIAMAHEIPYVATATVADLHDLEAKVAAAMSRHGARYLHVLVPCPLGWGSDAERHGAGGPARDPERTLPGLRGRARHGHPCHPDPAPGAGRGVPATAGPFQAPVRRARTPRRGCRSAGAGRPRHRPVRAGPRGGVMKLPFAVTLGPGSSRADHTGAWRTERAVYTERTAPCGNACPAGEDVRSWLYDAESGGAGYEAAWRRIMETNPFPAVCGRVCYHPCETACNRGNLDEAVGINSVERFLGDEALAQGWHV